MSKQVTNNFCTRCQDNYPVSEFYKSFNFDIHPTGFINLCKKCAKELVPDFNDAEALKSFLRMVDKPFIYHLWRTALDKETAQIGWYFKLINAKDFRLLTWKDSDFYKNSATESANFQVVDNITLTPSKREEDILDFTLTNDIIRFWGTGYTKEQYMKLTTFKEDMERSYDIETASHKDYLKKICIVSLKMEEALANNDINNFKKLSDAYDALMKSAKFTAVQRSAADRTGGLNTFSEFFEMIEKEGFIPKFHTDEPMDIVDRTIDNLKKFTRRLILGDPNIASIVDESLKKMNNKEDDEDDLILDNLDDDIYLDLVEDEEDGYN